MGNAESDAFGDGAHERGEDPGEGKAHRRQAQDSEFHRLVAKKQKTPPRGLYMQIDWQTTHDFHGTR